MMRTFVTEENLISNKYFYKSSGKPYTMVIHILIEKLKETPVNYHAE
jgi:hypothetical protein